MKKTKEDFPWSMAINLVIFYNLFSQCIGINVQCTISIKFPKRQTDI